MKTPRAYHIFAALAGLLGLYGIAASAIAAHAIPDAHAAARVSTAALYALIHAAVLLGWSNKGLPEILVKGLLVCGVVFFSGSLTLTYGVGLSGFTKLAPIGGTILLLGWFSLILASVRSALTSSRTL
ncbi:MAG: DUF423 domain-containing protein [Micavibrio aeruginosavorus]|uniref:DUF423 domain-containing protein n=1 Tax=Micavibrio aeruginosavorus TaxID=349221 RepID=A0A2W5A723_9BACT|nr:MAG: DUF423 domain-containing protein [Micavibrio aeruginosavorus]